MWSNSRCACLNFVLFELQDLLCCAQPKAVSETDDLELNALMERVARENKEVSGESTYALCGGEVSLNLKQSIGDEESDPDADV